MYYLHVFTAMSVVTLLINVANAQLIRQCQCSEIDPCKETYLNSVMPCADTCQHHATALGASYPKLKQCLLSQEPKLQSAIKCTESRHSDSCSRGPGGMVPKRYPETLKIAALSEINKMVTRSGLQNDVSTLMNVGKKLYGCIHSCMDKKAGNCAKKMGCGLALPSDSVMVQNAKQCAIQSGFNTQGVQQLCNCAAASGISQLQGICNRIIIS